MAIDDSFAIPRRTQKITSVQPVSVVQFAENVGNLPDNKKWSDSITDKNGSEPLILQAFMPLKERIKAIGVYLEVDFRWEGQARGRRTGSMRMDFYEWTNYPTSPAILASPDPTKQNWIEVNLYDVKNRSETIFEMEQAFDVDMSKVYCFTISQTEGFDPNKPNKIATTADTYVLGTLGDFWQYTQSSAITTREMPTSDLVFQAYVSITELVVEIIGTGTGSLTGIEDALQNPTGQGDPQAGFGIIDYSKPFKAHGQAFIDDSDTYGNAPKTIGVHGGFAFGSDLVIDMKTNSTPVFTAGSLPVLDDMTVDDAYTNLQDLEFTITVTAPGATDKFDWIAKDTGGTIVDSGIAVSMIALGNVLGTTGVTINFAVITGHGINSTWTFYCANWDTVLINTTERIRLDWCAADGSLDTTTSWRLMQGGEMIAIPEYVSKMAFSLHVAGDSAPEISITLWRALNE